MAKFGLLFLSCCWLAVHKVTENLCSIRFCWEVCFRYYQRRRGL